MKYLKFFTFCLTLFSLTLMAQESDTLSIFLKENPNAVGLDVVYEGTKINLAADDDNLLVNLSIAHPALQMRFMMQSASIYVDPTGKKKKDYEIILPSALDVKEALDSLNPDASKAIENTRPDILPLIRILNQKGAFFKIKNVARSLGFQRFYIELNQDEGVINYYILIPKTDLMRSPKLSNKWSIGIFSLNDISHMPSPEEGTGPGEGMLPPQIEGEDQSYIMELMQNDIRSWTKFSIDDVNNINLR